MLWPRQSHQRQQHEPQVSQKCEPQNCAWRRQRHRSGSWRTRARSDGSRCDSDCGAELHSLSSLACMIRCRQPQHESVRLHRIVANRNQLDHAELPDITACMSSSLLKQTRSFVPEGDVQCRNDRLRRHALGESLLQGRQGRLLQGRSRRSCCVEMMAIRREMEQFERREN